MGLLKTENVNLKLLLFKFGLLKYQIKLHLIKLLKVINTKPGARQDYYSIVRSVLVGVLGHNEASMCDGAQQQSFASRIFLSW